MAGANLEGDTTDDGNDDDLSPWTFNGCWDANADNFFRVYLYAGEGLSVIAGPLPETFALSLKVYLGESCGEESVLIGCEWGQDVQSLALTAAQDDWVTIVVDGASAFEEDQDWGPYELTVQLDGGCCCR